MMRSRYGFSLIEIMITLTIIAILSGFAVPVYQHYIIKSERIASEVSLWQLASVLEAYYTTHMTYNAPIQEFQIKQPKNYTLEITSATDTEFTLSAIPHHTNQSECGTLILSSSGKKSISGAISAEECWE